LPVIEAGYAAGIRTLKDDLKMLQTKPIGPADHCERNVNCASRTHLLTKKEGVRQEWPRTILRISAPKNVPARICCARQ
jgi:hypothetical protein